MAKPPSAGQVKREKFVNEYLICGNATEAAKKAGYSEHTAGSQGHRLMKLPDVAAAIEAGRKRIAEKQGVTAERVLAEYAKIGFANMGDYVTFTTGGDPIVDLSKLTPDQKAAIAELTVDDFIDGRGEDARDVRRLRFKLHDKLAALNGMARHLGMFAPDRLEVAGKDGGPIKTEEMSLTDLARRMAFILASAAAKPKEG